MAVTPPCDDGRMDTTALSPGRVLAELDAAVGRVLDLDGSLLSDVARGELIVGLQASLERLRVGLAEQAAAWDASRAWLADGSRSAKARLARDTKTAPWTAAVTLRQGRKLASMPLVRAAVVAGRLSMDHLDLLGRANQPERAALFARDEAMLVEQCAELRYGQARQVVEYWINHADEEAAAAARARRRAAGDEPSAGDADVAGVADHGPGDPGGDGEAGGGSGAAGGRFDAAGDHAHASRTIGGAVKVDGWFEDPIGGEIVIGELERLERQLYLADQRDGRSRTRAQRMAAAMVEMATRSASTPADARRPKPLITVIVGDDTAHRLCQLASGRILRPDQLDAHLDDATVEIFLFDGQTIISGSTQRSFTGRLRRAILARDRYQCQDPSGCDERGTHLDIDHIHPHALGGATDQFDARARCPTQNRDRRYHVHRPDDRPRTPRAITPTDIATARRRWRLHRNLPTDDDDHGDDDRGDATAHQPALDPRPRPLRGTPGTYRRSHDATRRHHIHRTTGWRVSICRYVDLDTRRSDD